MPPSPPPSRFLFRQARAKGDWLAPDPTATSCSPWASTAPSSSTTPPTSISSSSTISTACACAPGWRSQPFFVRLTRDLVRLLQERTEHGYVFRTDLRLRPDPGSTPLAHLHRRRAQLLRERRPELGARRPHQGARRSPATSPPGDALSRRPRALHLAQVPRLRGHRRHPRHEAADPRLPRLRRDRGCRPRHQGRPRRHPRDRVLRADPAADRRRPPARPARVARRCSRWSGWRQRGWIKAGVRRELDAGLSLPAHRRASPADDRRRADADAARRIPTSSPRSPASAASPTRPPSPRASPPSWNACRPTTFACSSTAPS